MSHPPPGADQPTSAAEEEYRERRRLMVETQLRSRDIIDPRVLDAMRQVPRHLLVPELQRAQAYMDGPLHIGHGQTISQPYIVALMTQCASPASSERALDVGTGSGYQAAVLGELASEVYSIEIIPELAAQARERLAALGYQNIHVRCGDGYLGWPDKAPFDVIVVAAAAEEIPAPLIDQLAPGGRLVMPVGTHFQELVILKKGRDGSTDQKTIAAVAFVPLVREPQKPPEDNPP